MSCEKASRRLRSLIVKAKRLGLTAEEMAKLPSVRKFASPRATLRTTCPWSIMVAILVLLGGSIVLVVLCAPCLVKRTTHDVRVLP